MTDTHSNAVRHYKDGETIVADGDQGSEMFVIISGAAQAAKLIDGERTILKRFEAGDFFGEMSLLEGQPRSADVVAIGNTDVIALGGGGLINKIRNEPHFALEMLKSLSSRLRDTNHRYENAVLEINNLKKQIR
ncbi:MAG: Crp/Fnr family transcriptional regulator [Pontibacterium sp.]